MRPLSGLLYALGGAAAGLMLGLGGAMLFARLTNMTNREGAAGYFMLSVGIVGAVAGLVAGIVLFVRSAPAGEGAKQLLAAVLGLTALVLLLVGGVWAMMQMREVPLKYDGAFATLELEMRFNTADLPADESLRWLWVVVQTERMRPEGTPLASRMRVEGTHTIIPVVQQPLFRAGRRTLVVRLAEEQVESYNLPMKRTPDPHADWSEWLRPDAVEAVSGGTTPSLTAKSAMRFRVRRYGE